PLVPLLKNKRAFLQMLVTTVTDTGNEVARQKVPDADAILYFPLDFPFAVRRALDIVAPKLVLLTETELWPNFLLECHRRRIPVLLINGRVSHASFKRYRLIRSFMKRVLQGIEHFCMQSERHAERIIQLGAPPSRVEVVGNLKFDALAPSDGDGEIASLRKELHLAEGVPVFVAGSTHRGEEEAVLQALKRVREAFRDLVLVLAPRHPDRLPEVEALLKEEDLSFVRRTELARLQSPISSLQSPVILVDTVGELTRLYALGDVVFVGGSLVPTGGHNILEPAASGRAILFGPHMENFAEIAELFLGRGAALQVGNADELAARVFELLKDPGLASNLGQAASSTVSSQRGACLRTIGILEKYL
ncbi:MAG: 3-deoxy-D-manno-octulosonic acid transferase, partial [candidate division NC10 bacterium]|nr:3-deoxy-D-manno-octulosonic acid transferase [candidate division NC10 bacterium]